MKKMRSIKSIDDNLSLVLFYCLYNRYMSSERGDNNMKRLFISQPMRDKTDEQILAERKRAIKEAKEMIGEDVEVIDSFFKEAPHDAKPLWYLAKSLELLAAADVAYFCTGWELYRGCKIEHTCAVEYGIDRIES